ncbi:unnamed protein product [Echinostoma caproni]|uniref:Cytochrome b5 heme-binding domain-containing protein n=1 Tax=Echinostoma caproni TaxID=27848 RepID=A0A183BFP6_9TREM|nr:unnamed protein product [Echinostoma caproni]
MHPGGNTILLAAGKDVESFWSIYAFHYESHVMDLLKEYYIGDLLVTPRIPQSDLSHSTHRND